MSGFYDLFFTFGASDAVGLIANFCIKGTAVALMTV